MLTAPLLQTGLNTQRFARRIFSFETIDSTNNCAKVLAGCFAEEGTVVIAESQSAGRGRLGRPWLSNPNENLTFSVVLRPALSPESINLLPLSISLAIAGAIEKATGLSVQCKWPNDLLVAGKKVAGILLEGSVKQNALEYVVIGIGVNVNQITFPHEIDTTATSLRKETGKEIDRPLLFREIMTALEREYSQCASEGFPSVPPRWLQRAAIINKTVTLSQNGQMMSGVVRGISGNGGLLVQIGDATRTFLAGDVTILKE